MKATDMVAITAAKANVTPMISAIRPFSTALCCASFSLVVAVELTSFFSSIVGTEFVDLRNLSSGLKPKIKQEKKAKWWLCNPARCQGDRRNSHEITIELGEDSPQGNKLLNIMKLYYELLPFMPQLLFLF